MKYKGTPITMKDSNRVRKQYMGHGNTMLEVYTPGDMQAPDYECGIWVPMEQK